MSDSLKLNKLRLALLTSAVAAGVFGSTALAEDNSISQKDIITQAVALYEKLSGTEVDVPESMSSALSDADMGKAVVLGFTNADELENVSGETGLRKQDAMTVLYKTIINFDDSFALSTDEVDEIMNRCYDNALVDEENRVGYAFMLKHRIIKSGSDTEPNKEITWESCKILVDVLYDVFMQDVCAEVNGVTIKIGANIETLTDEFGEPDRVDKSDSGFDWYIYNSDYSKFMMVGVDEGRICAFYSNADGVILDKISTGDDYLLTYKYAENSSFRFFADSDDNVDAVLYNPYAKDMYAPDIDSRVRSLEIVDMVNAARVKRGLEPLEISQAEWERVSTMPLQAKYTELAKEERYSHEMDDAIHEMGYDAFSIYSALLKHEYACFDKDTEVIGVATNMQENYLLCASVSARANNDDITVTTTDSMEMLAETVATEAPAEKPVDENTDEEAVSTIIENTGTSIIGEVKNTADTTDSEIIVIETVATPSPTAEVQDTNVESQAMTADTQAMTADAQIQTDTEEVAQATEEPTPEPTSVPGSPEIDTPNDGAIIPNGEDVVIKLKESAAAEYYVRIYSVEDDNYIVDSYIRSTGTELVFESELFEAGKDYTVSIGAVKNEGTLDSKDINISYGKAPDDAVTIDVPEQKMVTDNDYIGLEWSSDIYHDFVVDVYDDEGKLILSQPVIDTKSLKITDVYPGTYFVYVNAVRRGSEDIIKAQSAVTVTIKQPEPVITEYILEEGEVFYPIYEDPQMGILYFYDEDIVEVDGEQYKKITEKQVKSTAKYRRLAAAQQRVEYFEGNDELSIKKPTVMSNPGSASGNAIVDEASKYLGVPYVWGGTTPKGFDCSGLVQYVHKSLGIELSRVTYTQCKEGIEIRREDMQPGDLIFFADDGDVHHVGIYAGNGMMIHAPYTGTVVQYQSIDTPYYASQFYCARRIVN